MAAIANQAPEHDDWSSSATLERLLDRLGLE